MQERMTEGDILNLIQKDAWRMDALKAAQSLNLPDWWIGAGFVRSKVWDRLHGYTSDTSLPDIDVVYFDNKNLEEDIENIYQEKLAEIMPGPNWSVTNQARMHLFHNRGIPYKDSAEALSDWVETATCIAVKIDKGGKLILVAPHGIEDLVNLVLRPTSSSPKVLERFDQRIQKKGWLTKWPKLRVVK